MIEALVEVVGDTSAAWFTEADGTRAVDAVEHADLVVICRSPYSQFVASVIERAHGLGLRVLFDVDDLVFDTRYTHLLMETLDISIQEADLVYWFAYTSRLAATLRLCDGAITTNAFLAERLRDVHDVPISIIPNFLNRRQLEISARVLMAKETSGFARDDRIHLGYFSGSHSHNRDFAIVKPALERLLLEDPRLSLRIVGFLDGHPAMSNDRLEVFPLQDFINLQRLIGEVEFNLVPLQDNDFTNCKSELKYFEASVVGTVSIASPTFTLKQVIRHGENGMLAFAHEWEAALRQAIDEIDGLQRMARAAAADALQRYSPSVQGPALRSALLDGT
jgi:glycosyltransferase involved in cell wall biosynthesis